MSTKSYVVRPSSIDTVLTDWTTAKVMSDPRSTTVKGLSVVVLFFEPGCGHSRHFHPDAEQVIYVISGEGEHTTEIPGTQPLKEKISAGSLIHIPKGAYHSTYNTGWEPMKLVAVFSPAGPEAALVEMGDSGGVGTAKHRVLPPGEIPVRN